MTAGLQQPLPHEEDQRRAAGHDLRVVAVLAQRGVRLFQAGRLQEVKPMHLPPVLSLSLSQWTPLALVTPFRSP